MNSDQMPASSYILEARDLSVALGGRKVLEIPSLQVLANETMAVVGPNGSGKTTLLLSLALLLRPATGTISYEGKPISYGPGVLGLRRRFAVVFQDPLLLGGTVWDNVTLGLRLRGFSKGDIRARASKWLGRFGIASLTQRQAKTLSGGEAKRVSLARAFALQPEVLFLDEPFAALDSPTRQALIEDFESVLRETKVTTVMVTHDRNEALILADRVALLMNGSIRQIGTPQEVFSYPVDEEAASFVGAGSIVHGVVSLHNSGLASVDVGGQRIDAVSNLAAGTKVTVFLHHEDVTVSLPTPQIAPSSARNQLRGKITKMFIIDSQVRVTIDCGFPLVALITKRSGEDLALNVGREVVASFKASSVHLIARH